MLDAIRVTLRAAERTIVLEALRREQDTTEPGGERHGRLGRTGAQVRDLQKTYGKAACREILARGQIDLMVEALRHQCAPDLLARPPLSMLLRKLEMSIKEL